MNQLLELYITDMSYKGKGIAKQDNRIFFVDNAIDQETVLAKVYSEKGNYSLAKTVNILKPSIHRTESICVAYPDCGGCSLRHVSYERQLILKKDIVRSNLKRIAGIDIDDINIIPGSSSDFYRNKADYKVQNGTIGFYKTETHLVIPHEKCYLVHSDIDAVKRIIEPYVTDDITKVIIKKADQGCMVIIKSDEDLSDELIDNLKMTEQVVSLIHIKNDREHLLFGSPAITDILLGLEFQMSPESFYQVNKEQTEKLYSIAKQYIKKSYNPQQLKQKTLLDLYCGIGTISLFMADSVKHVTGIEISKSAIDNAKRNASINSIENVSFICSDVKDAVSNQNFDILIVDPPRKGLDPAVVDAIKQKKPDTMIYISCDSATLARDLNLLKDTYSLQDITLVDMFANTEHVECVVLMSLENQ